MSTEPTKSYKPTSRWAKTIENGVMWGLVLSALFLLAYAFLRRMTAGKQEKKEYSERIINKFTTSSEWHTGSTFTRYIEVEEKTGERRRLVVREDLYEKAEPEMWVEVSETGMRLYRPDEEIGPSAKE